MGSDLLRSRWLWLIALAALVLPLLWIVNRLIPAPKDLGVTNGRLAPCPESPNAVSSQAGADDAMHRVEPLPLPPGPESAHGALARLAALVETLPGTRRVAEQPGYLRYEFRTAVCRFVDDVEFAVDEAARRIHVRSASRVGYSDLGTNRRRVEEIRRRWVASGEPAAR